jgi:hypothetical protein
MSGVIPLLLHTLSWRRQTLYLSYVILRLFIGLWYLGCNVTERHDYMLMDYLGYETKQLWSEMSQNGRKSSRIGTKRCWNLEDSFLCLGLVIKCEIVLLVILKSVLVLLVWKILFVCIRLVACVYFRLLRLLTYYIRISLKAGVARDVYCRELCYRNIRLCEVKLNVIGFS